MMPSRSLEDLSVLVVGAGTPDSVLRHMASFIARHPRRRSSTFALCTHPPPATWSLLQQSEFVLAVGSAQPRLTTLDRGRSGVIYASLIDIALTTKFVLRLRRRFHIYIGAGQHLILLGLFFRRLGIVKEVVAFSMDYWPKKYPSLLNFLYQSLDAFCITRADWVFNASPAMFEARLRRGMKLKPARHVTVPHPVQAEEIGYVSREELEPDSLIFAGLAGAEYGFELLIEAMVLVLRRHPAAIVTVTGYGEFPLRFRKLLHQRGLARAFRLAGFISDASEFRQVLRRQRIGLAPYSPSVSSCKRYTDVSRPKVYMANGVPPVITRVPPIAREIEAIGAGLVIDYDREQLANAIHTLFTDDELHEYCRQRGLDLVKRYDAETICRDALDSLSIASDKLVPDRKLDYGAILSSIE